jgi:hypothetical protein
MAEKKRKGRTGYIQKSPAICITVYDLHGQPIPAKIVEEILDTVNEKSLANGLMISFTRT